MNINRALVKQQAKELLKGNVLKFFLVSLIVGAIIGAASGLTTDYNEVINNIPGSSESEQQDTPDPFNFDGSGGIGDNPLDGFGGRITLRPGAVSVGNIAARAVIFGAFSGLFGMIISYAVQPLGITLFGVYWELIRGKNMALGDALGYVFKKTFDKNYWNKFLLSLLQGLALGALTVLFIIPGVIFYYKWYFTSFILVEKPELTFSDAMRISDKMTKGHKGELFALSLSFIGWALLAIPTLGLISIYLTPYISTTKALYYENFKARGFQNGEITADDFLSAQEKVAQTAAQMQQNTYAQPQQTYFQPAAPVTPVQQDNTYYQPTPAENTYYQPTAPAEPVVPAAPAENTYYQPTAPVEPIIPETPTENTYYQPTAPIEPIIPEAPSEAEAPAMPEEAAVPETPSVTETLFEPAADEAPETPTDDETAE